MLKAGDVQTGMYAMRVSMIKPNHDEVRMPDFSVFFNGPDENGVAVISPLNIPNPDEGLHWFDVYFLERLITRIPMRVIYQQIQLQIPQGL
jgi:hypothetical protein